MGAIKGKSKSKLELFVSPQDYFRQAVRQAFNERKVETFPHVETYLSGLLEFYLDARNLYEADEHNELGHRKPKTLAEIYLLARNSELSQRVEMLKRLADRALYMSGFFGDSFERKIIDIDYYAEMGCSAYRELSTYTKQDTLSKVYRTFSDRFGQFMDVLAYISQNSMVQSDQSVLRLYDRYLRTGSELAREKLVEMGVLTLPLDQAKLTRQG